MVLAADNTCTEAIIRDTREFNIYTRCCELLSRVKREISYIYKYFLSKIHDSINTFRYLSRVLSFLDEIFKLKKERERERFVEKMELSRQQLLIVHQLIETR